MGKLQLLTCKNERCPRCRSKNTISYQMYLGNGIYVCMYMCKSCEYVWIGEPITKHISKHKHMNKKIVNEAKKTLRELEDLEEKMKNISEEFSIKPNNVQHPETRNHANTKMLAIILVVVMNLLMILFAYIDYVLLGLNFIVQLAKYMAVVNTSMLIGFYITSKKSKKTELNE